MIRYAIKAFVIASAIGVVSSIASAQMPTDVARASAKLEKIIQNHPEPLVREKLLAWLKSGRVKFAANNLLPEMNSSVEEMSDKAQVLMWYNVEYILRMPYVTTPEDKHDLLELMLYHEAVHIDDHFSGRLLLLPLIPKPPIPSAKVADMLWNREWSAVSKEWMFAKKISKPYLLPVIYAATRSGETPKTFLEGFYQLQMSGNAVAQKPDLAAGFTLRYRRELEKLK